MTSTESLRNRTNLLITRLSVITFIVLFVTSFAIYLLINYTLQSPLRRLLKGVKSVEHGNLEARVNLESQNELNTLAEAFNKMTDTIERSAEDLHLANETLEQKVKDRTNDLVEAQQQLIMSEKMASLGQLVSGVAHEINTPLGNSITALSYNQENLQKIKTLFDSEKVKSTDFAHYIDQTFESLKIMETNLSKASELVTTFKRVSVDQSVEEIEQINVKSYIEEILLTLNPKIKQADIQVHLDLEEGLQIQSYAGVYYQVITNLIMNSVTHAFPDQKETINIQARSTPDNNSMILVFKDDGVGMDEQTQNKVFDPFFTTKRGAGGTGLGMYMTFNMVTQKLDGKIDLTTAPDEGVCFTITTPLTLKKAAPSDDTLF